MSLIAALAASVLLNAAVLLQAHDARQAPAELAMKPGLIFFLLRRRLWLLGTACTAISAVLQILALARMSVAVVQAISAAGVLLLPLWAWAGEGRRPRASTLGALFVILGGVTIGALTVQVGSGALRSPPAAVIAVALVAGVVAGGLGRWRQSAGLLSFAAGIAFAASTLLQKIFALQSFGVERLVTVVFLVSTGAVGFLAEMTALQQGSAVEVAPTVLAVSAAVPVFGGRIFFDESWPHPLLTAVAFLAALGGSVFISATHAQAHPPRAPA